MAAAARRAFDPFDIPAVAVAAHESQIGLLVLVPGPVNPAALHLFVVDGERNQEEGDMVLGHGEVMHAAHVRHPDFGAPELLAELVDLEHRDHIAAEAAGLVAESDDVAGGGAHLRMCGERLLPGQLAVKCVDRIERRQRVEVERGRRAVLLQRQQ